MTSTPVLCITAVLLLVAGLAVGVLISRSRSAARIAALAAERDAAAALAAERAQRAEADRAKAESQALDLSTRLAAADGAVRESAARIAALTAERDAAEALAAERAERADGDRVKAESLAADLSTRLAEAEAAVSELNTMRAGLQAREEALKEARIQIEAAQAESLQLLDAKFAEITNRALSESRSALAAESEVKLSDANKPVADMLGRMDEQLKALAEKTVASDAKFAQQMNAVVKASRDVELQTAKLASAFLRPQVRGAWGEMHLRRVVEVAGMVEYTDFSIQTHAVNDEGAKLRPDMVVRLAGGRTIVVDSKVSMQAFLDAAEADDDTRRAESLKLHAKHVRTHVDTLASKAYGRSVDGAAEFTVLFLATEDALLRAVEHDGALIEYAAGKGVIVATPATLIAMLRVAAQAWTEHATADSAREVLDLGRNLFERLKVFTGHLDKVGQSLDRSVVSYNEAVGSLSNRVLVSARKLAEMKVASGDIGAPRIAEGRTREIPALNSVV